MILIESINGLGKERKVLNKTLAVKNNSTNHPLRKDQTEKVKRQERSYGTCAAEDSARMEVTPMRKALRTVLPVTMERSAGGNKGMVG